MNSQNRLDSMHFYNVINTLWLLMSKMHLLLFDIILIYEINAF